MDSNELYDAALRVLADVHVDPEHHFDRTYLTAHQIGAAINASYDTGQHTGGEGTGHGSLTERVARLLSGRIANGDTRVEGAWLASDHLTGVIIDGDVRPTTATSQRGMSMYRLT
jgi:hypothetical protein